MSEFKQYRRVQIAEMKPWTPGMVLGSGVSIGGVDRMKGSPKEGDMIARNPKNHADMWLVEAQYFTDNFEPHEVDACQCTALTRYTDAPHEPTCPLRQGQ